MATTNIGALLLGELQALSAEARRKHPEIKEAAERVIVVLRGIAATSSGEIAKELAASDEVISPFVLGCKSSNHKLAAMSVQCLQQLISHRAVSPRSIAQTLSTLNTVIHLGVDIQVKILQMVLPLVTMYDGCVFGETLVDAFHLCLALQKSRDPVVSNTAAAILRQVVVAVFDRVVAEDQEHSDDDDEGADTRERDLTRKYAKDAFFVLQDLCLLAADSDSIFIRVDAVDKGLVLDLIESVLVNHAAVVARHTAMVHILRERLAPFIVGFFAEKAPFTLVVRCIRIVWLFIRDLHTDLVPECEMLLSILTRLIDSSSSSSNSSSGGKSGRSSVSLPRIAGMQSAKTVLGSGFPLFYRVLAMEVLRNTLREPQLLHRLYAQFDGRAADGSEDCHVIGDVFKAVSKVATERPELRVSNPDGIPSALPIGAQAGDAGDSADSRQVGAHSCCLRTEMHKLLDKHEPPLMPEPYLAYLAFTAMVGAADGLAERVLPLCTENVRSSALGSAPGSVFSPALAPALADEHVASVKKLVQDSWPVLLSVYTFYFAVRLDDALFRQVMDTMQKLVQVSGAFGLLEARDAFLLLLCRSCLPQAAIADHERQLQQGHGRAGVGLPAVDEAAAAEDAAEPSKTQAALPLVTTSLAGVAFAMNARQVECLRAVVACAQYLAAVLGPLWYPVLVTLQQAEELLHQSHGMSASAAAAGGSSGAAAASTGPPAATAPAPSRRASVSNPTGVAAGGSDAGQSSASDLAQIRSDYARLLGFVRASGADATAWAVRALCVLGSDLSTVPADPELQADEAAMRATSSVIHRRLSAVLNRPTFAIGQLCAFAAGNVDLLVGAAGDASAGDDAWRVATRHLLATATYPHAPPAMRTQACGAVSAIVLAAMDLVAQADEEPELAPAFVAAVASGAAQVRILTPLLQMLRGTPGDGFAAGGRFVDVSKLTLDTVHRVLQASGRSIMRAWGVVFDIVHSVLDEPPAEAAASAGAEARQPGYLMRCVFPCLQLICSDYLEDLPPHCLRRCIECLALFGRQNEDLNIALTAIGQAWALCDFLQGLSAAPAAESGAELVSGLLAAGSERDAIARAWWHEPLGELASARTQQVLWTLLLHALAELGRDRRHEVRLGAVQTLFRTLDMRGDAFDAWLWDAVAWAVVLPLARFTLTQRAYVFGLVHARRLDELLEDAQAEAARVAGKSGVVAEDPARLYARQWDETAATALLGAARVWAAPRAALLDIGCAEQAWQCVWLLVQALFVGAPADAVCACLPDPACAPALDVPADFVASLAAAEAEGAAELRARLRTRDSLSAAIDCASTLVSSARRTSAAGWRIGWRAWLAMGALAARVPGSAGRGFNEDAQGTAAVTPDALCAYLRLCPTIANALRAAGGFTEADARALLHLARVVLMHVEIPLHAADDCKMTAVQAQVLDIVLLILDGGGPGASLDSAAAATALAAENLAALAVLPYAVLPRIAREQHGALAAAAVVERTRAAFAPMTERLDVLYPADGEPAAAERKRPLRRVVRPGFGALAASALARLGAVLCELPSDEHLKRALLSGVWQDAVVAMGLHMVAPLAPERQGDVSDWFVRAVPSGMIRLRAASTAEPADGARMRSALAAAWQSVGAVLAQTIGIPRDILELRDDCSCSERPSGDAGACGLAAAVQIRILDAIAAASLEYIANEEATAGSGQPPEVAAYWPMLVRILEWGAVLAAEPVVLLGAAAADDFGTGGDFGGDLGGSDGLGVQALTMACFSWLLRMSSGAGQPAPAWVSAAAAPALVRRSAMALDTFVGDKRLVGKSPLPQSRIVLVRLVLQGLVQLQCHPAALARSAGSDLAQRASASAAAHIFALYDRLVELVAVPDPDVLPLVQRCLKRVSAEMCG
ncbi:Endocytosis and vacuole integrity protein [Coemansia sp. RSA 2611]|nr:Endocytosis and vacuole integrity protein [Coemansia sp. RSA 2611]